MDEMARALGRWRRGLFGTLLGSAIVLVMGCAGETEMVADLLLQNGKVVTVDEAVPEGEAIAVHTSFSLGVPVPLCRGCVVTHREVPGKRRLRPPEPWAGNAVVVPFNA